MRRTIQHQQQQALLVVPYADLAPSPTPLTVMGARARRRCIPHIVQHKHMSSNINREASEEVLQNETESK